MRGRVYQRSRGFLKSCWKPKVWVLIAVEECSNGNRVDEPAGRTQNVPPPHENKAFPPTFFSLGCHQKVLPMFRLAFLL